MNSKVISQIHFNTLATILMAFTLTFFAQDLSAKKQKGKGPYSYIEFPSNNIQINGTTIKEVTVMKTPNNKKYYLSCYEYTFKDLSKYAMRALKTQGKLLTDEAFFIHGVDPIELRKDKRQFIRHIYKSFFLPGKDSLKVDALFRQHPTIWYILEGDGKVTAYFLRTDYSIFNLYTPEEVMSIFENINKYKFSTLPAENTIGKCSDWEQHMWY